MKPDETFICFIICYHMSCAPKIVPLKAQVALSALPWSRTAPVPITYA